MKQTLTAQRDTIIFDNDGVFYSWNVYGGMSGAKEFCAGIKAEVIPQFLPILSAEQARKLGKRSYRETGDGLRYFVNMAAQRGYDLETFREDIHTAYHQLQLHRVQTHYPAILAACSETVRHFNALSNHARFGVLSQGCRDNWINPLLEKKNILSYFDQDHIFGFKEFGWNEKSANTKGLEIIMQKMNADPSRVVFVEDTKKNLIKVKDTFPEVLTVHIEDWEKALPEDHYIDVVVPSNVVFLRKFRAAHLDMTPRLQSASNVLGLHP